MVWCPLSNLEVRGAPWLDVMGELKCTAREEQQIAASCAALVVWADDGLARLILSSFLCFLNS